ncbi:MAG: cobalt-precorrin-5B (C(1))-methyltransferase CbiD [Eubacteriales bacterium]
MAFEQYIIQDGVRLRRGFTTGTCAALATKAAATVLLGGDAPTEVSVMTPKNLLVTAEVAHISIAESQVTVSIVKDGGDDIDATHGAEIRATVSKSEGETAIFGGEGVGTVTKAGLDQPPGNPAINSGPRRQILGALTEVSQTFSYEKGFSVTISVPDGGQIAQRTFNPQIGIVGGISILGTSGIVEPRSLKALLDSLAVEVRVLSSNGGKIAIITPGNYGEHFLESYPKLGQIPQIKCANFIGDTIDMAVENGLEQVLLVGHLGKMSKISGGIMNTHSKTADCRTELFTAHAALAGCDQETAQNLMEAATSDSCLDILEGVGLMDTVLQSMTTAAQKNLTRRAGNLEIGLITFTNQRGLLTVSPQAEKILQDWSTSL